MRKTDLSKIQIDPALLLVGSGVAAHVTQEWLPMLL